MTNETAEEAMRRACDSILSGDFMTAMGDFTPEALNSAMLLAGGLANLTMPNAYVIDSHEEQGGDHRFDVRFQAGEREMKASATWRLVEGAWKIVGVTLDGI